MSAPAARLEVSGLQKRFGGLDRGEGRQLLGSCRRDPRAHRAEWIGQVDGDEVDPRRRAARFRDRSGSMPARSRAGRRTGSPGLASAWCSSIRARCIGRRCSRTSCLGFCPTDCWIFFPAPPPTREARAIAERVGLTAVLDRRPATLPFADLRKIEIAKAIARDPQVVLIDEPFAGLTARETASFAKLITEMRDDGRAVLIVDHNVKSMSALVDRVYAMNVGEKIAEGTVAEVMANETVRKVYLGGALETAARPESAFDDAQTPFLEIENLSVVYDKAQALEGVSLHVHEGRVRRHRRTERRRQDDAVQRVSGLVPYAGDIRRQGKPLRGQTAAMIAREGIVQSPERPRIVRPDDGRRESGHGRAWAQRQGARRAPGVAVQPVPDPERAAEPDRSDAVGRRAANADHRARADDEARSFDPR